MRLTAVAATNLYSPQPAGALSRRLLDRFGLEPEAQITVRSATRAIAVWIYAAETLPGGMPQDASHPDMTIWLSRRARELLGFETGGEVEVLAPASKRLSVVPAYIDDLPPVHEVHVSREIKAVLAPGHSWCLLVADGWTMPARLGGRRMRDDRVRMSYYSRVLLGITRETANAEPYVEAHAEPEPSFEFQTVHVSAFVEHSLPWSIAFRRRSPTGRRFGPLAGTAQCCARVADQFVEWLLRPLLGAPAIAFRTTGALVGDDTNQVVRLSREVFPLVGVKPGDQVIVSWAGRQAVATALEGIASVETRPVDDGQVIAWPTKDAKNIPLDYLSVGIGAEMRADLGMSRHTVVLLRRRLRTALFERANDLTIPVGGLLLASLLIEWMKPPLIAVGLAFILLLGMAPIRYRTPPRGRWP